VDGTVALIVGKIVAGLNNEVTCQQNGSAVYDVPVGVNPHSGVVTE